MTAAKPAVEELPWCGRCRQIGRNRLHYSLVTPPGGREVEIICRCPDCSPHPAGCAHHVTPPARACELCLHNVGPRADRPYAGPPSRPPGPHEPGDLMRMPVIDVARELKDLREAGPLPERTGPRPDWEDVLLRQIAARQYAASRATGIRGLFREPEHMPPAGRPA